MIDLSQLKAAGWQRVVAELNAQAPDDRVYYERLLRIMAQVSAARQAVLYLPDRSDGEDVDPRVDMVWPPTELDKDAEKAASAVSPGASQVQFGNEARTAARGAFSTGQARAFGLDKEEVFYGDTSQSGYLLAIPLGQRAAGSAPPTPAGSPTREVPHAAVTLLIEPRSKEAVRSTLAMAEVLAGYVAGHHARTALKKTQASGFALDLAARLIASINNSSNFKGACLQLCNDLAKQFALDRVALGWVTSDVIRVKAISDVEHFDHRTNMVQKVASAMDECLDQEQPVVFPQPPSSGEGSDVLLSQAIVHAHRELAAGSAKLKVCSLPLREGDDVIGVCTFETAGDGPIDLATIELIQAAMDLVAPVLKIRRSDDRALPLRAWDSTKRAAAWFVGTKHTVWKVVGILALAALLFFTFYTTTYRPGAEATLEPRVRRFVSAPFEGVVKSVGPCITPGCYVKEKDVLVELDTSELELALKDAEGRIDQARTQASAARKAKDQSKVAQAEQQEERAASEADRYRFRIEKSRIIAPISGTIIAGDVKDRIGSTVKTGDLLMQIAPLDDIIVVAKVDERDIGLVKNAFDAGKGFGEVASQAKPDEALPITIERIVPLASAVEGKNIFEVRAALKGRPDWFSPGVEGIARFDTVERSLLWIGTRRILDQARLWLWW